jgi:hypothetical protein
MTIKKDVIIDMYRYLTIIDDKIVSNSFLILENDYLKIKMVVRKAKVSIRTLFFNEVK